MRNIADCLIQFSCITFSCDPFLSGEIFSSVCLECSRVDCTDSGGMLGERVLTNSLFGPTEANDGTCPQRRRLYLLHPFPPSSFLKLFQRHPAVRLATSLPWKGLIWIVECRNFSFPHHGPPQYCTQCFKDIATSLAHHYLSNTIFGEKGKHDEHK